MSEDNQFKRYDHSRVIGEHVKNLSRQVSELEDTDQKNWSEYFNGVLMGLAYLDALIDPFKPEDFDEVFTENLNYGTTKGKQIQFVHEALAKYFNLMKNEGLFYTAKRGRRTT